MTVLFFRRDETSHKISAGSYYEYQQIPSKSNMAMGQNPVSLWNIQISGKWTFIPPNMIEYVFIHPHVINTLRIFRDVR